MKTSLLVLLILLLACPAFCQNKISFEPTLVNFVIKNAGLKVNGSFSGLEGFIILDAQNLSLLKIEGTIDPNTVNTGITLRDNHLKKGDYFNVKEFPKIVMVSTQIKKSSTRKYVGNFDLTIKNSRKNVLIPFTFSAKGNTYKLEGEFSINRLDFQLGESSIILSDTVKIMFEITSKK